MASPSRLPHQTPKLLTVGYFTLHGQPTPVEVLSLPEQLTATILVVEDNPVERQLVGRLLRNANFEVITVDTGQAVLDTVITHQPDLILLDALLPDVDGFDVCEVLRDHPKGKFIPVLMLTGLDDDESINRAYRVGATDFFTKPINHSLLIHRIRYLLRARQLMDELRLSRESLASAQAIAQLGYWEFDQQRQLMLLSDKARNIYQISARGELIRQALLQRCHPDDREHVQEVLQHSLHYGQTARTEHRIILDDGTERHIELHMKGVSQDDGRFNRLLGISMDITERVKSQRQVLELAYIDSLTELPNRSLIEFYLQQAIPRSHLQGACVGLLAIDLDLFNRINNAMGHTAGDAVLKQLTLRLREQFTLPQNTELLDALAVSTEKLGDFSADLLARLGADTFVILKMDVQRSGGELEQLAETIRQLFKQPFIYRGQELFTTASFGLAYSESGSSTAQTLLQQVDLALHEAKYQGRDQIQSYSGNLVDNVSSRLAIQSELRKALSNNEFSLCYQPKLSPDGKRLFGFEALLRWQHPRKGNISPARFIPIAEETGQIVEMGLWVLRTACLQFKQWLEQGLAEGVMAVNVAARQFQEAGIVETITAVLDETGLPPQHLQLEITEGVLIANPQTEQIIARLRETGISIALDDFGTGFSSLSYITRFPIDTIKIDRCFVQHIEPSTVNAAIVEAICSLSESLGLSVVAEGVETEQELAVVGELGCDEVQGYYFCKPMDAEDTQQWLKNRQIDE